MKKRNRNNRLFKRPLSILLPLLFLVLILFFIFIPFQKSVVFYYENTDTLLAYLPLEKNHTFQIKYTHSIHLSDVVETYEATNKGEIRQTELEFEDFAIGMPANAGQGEKFVKEDGKYYIKNMNRVFPYIDLKVGQVRANHRLIVNGQEYEMKSFVKPGTWVRIDIEKLSFWKRMKGVNIHE
ncbi:DUF1850 domain-containing protein [Peribacillus tepidiphilus]|uniref:DUF1850 domain-containing protein n=1 Tax=Peribacillus tepidiphilus TaxID=2652445 RepID=UPI0012910B4B|nr:DUF1850 domain-containing protein [Peribacillus tepidiphilus]